MCIRDRRCTDRTGKRQPWKDPGVRTGQGQCTVIRIAWSIGIICLSPASGIVKKLRRAGQPLCHAAVLLVCDDPGNDITVLRFLPDITQKSGVGKISALFSDRIQQSDRLYRQTIHQSGPYLDVKKMDLCLYPVCTDDFSLWDQPVTVEWEEPQGEICGTGWTCHSYHRNASDPEYSIFNGKDVWRHG